VVSRMFGRKANKSGRWGKNVYGSDKNRTMKRGGGGKDEDEFICRYDKRRERARNGGEKEGSSADKGRM